MGFAKTWREGRILGVAIWCLGEAAAAQGDWTMTETAYLSGERRVPATVGLPTMGHDRVVPLVIMAHGHGGDRDEAGGFSRVATALAGRGIASLRMDFPGCGASSAPFADNYLSNMLQDIESARAYALAELPVDPKRMALLGYSMGARLAVLASARQPYAALALWAPVGLDGDAGMHEFLGGERAFRALEATAEVSGSAQFTTPWGDEQVLSLRWFHELARSRPTLEMQSYAGPTLVLHGTHDRAVPPANAEALIAAARRGQAAVVAHFIEGADHGLGFYSGQTDISRQVIDLTVGFFDRNLNEAVASGAPD